MKWLHGCWRLGVPRATVVALSFWVCQAQNPVRAQAPVTVTDPKFGAISRDLDDPKIDDAAAFQKAIDAQGAAGGGLVNIPVGVYWFNGALSIPDNVVLSGETPGPFDPAQLKFGQNPSNTPTGAAVLVVRGTSATAPFIRLVGMNACIQNLLFYYSGQVTPDAEAPKVMGATLSIERGGVRVVGCSFTNSYVGILVHRGRVTLHNLNLGAYLAGIIVDQAEDTVRIDTVTIHPFFDIWTGRKWGILPSKIDRWVFENGYGVISQRADALQLRDVMVFARFCGLRLEASSAGPTFGDASGLQFDSVKFGVIASATAARGVGFFISDSYIDAWGHGNGLASQDGIVLIHDPLHPGTSYISFTGGSIAPNGFQRSVYVNPGAGMLRTTSVEGVPDGTYQYPGNYYYKKP